MGKQSCPGVEACVLQTIFIWGWKHKTVNPYGDVGLKTSWVRNPSSLHSFFQHLFTSIASAPSMCSISRKLSHFTAAIFVTTCDIYQTFLDHIYLVIAQYGCYIEHYFGARLREVVHHNLCLFLFALDIKTTITTQNSPLYRWPEGRTSFLSYFAILWE